MADTTEIGLKNVTDELVKTNKKLDSLDLNIAVIAKPSGPLPLK